MPVSPWREGEEVETVGGGKVKWVKEGGTVFVSFLSSLSEHNFWGVG